MSFTGQNKDTDWLNFDFMYREYDPRQGRWLSPDPSGLAAVDPSDPQSWNRYAYVENNPLNFTDPFGLFHRACLSSGCDWGLGGGSPCDMCGGLRGGDDGGPLGANEAANESAWLGSGNIPWYSVQGGNLMLLTGHTFIQGLCPPGSQCGAENFGTFVPDWTNLGAIGNGSSGGDSWAVSNAANNGMYFAGVLPPGMNGPAIYAKWATRGRPPTNLPNPQNPIWPQGAPPEVNPPVLPSDVPWYKAIPALLMELLDGIQNISVPVMVDPCLTNPGLRCGLMRLLRHDFRSFAGMDTAHFERIAELRDSGRLEDAIRESQVLLTETTDANEKASILTGVHVFYCTLGRLKEARQTLGQLKQVHISEPEVLLNAEFCEPTLLIQEGRYEEGLSAFVAMLDRHSEAFKEERFRYLYEDIQCRRALTLVGLSRFKEALPTLRRHLFFLQPGDG